MDLSAFRGQITQCTAKQNLHLKITFFHSFRNEKLSAALLPCARFGEKQEELGRRGEEQ